MKTNYLKRTVDVELDSKLEAFGAVLIEGPKWCGKTRTAEEHSKSALYMQDPDSAASHALTADTKPSLLLRGDTPRLIDEWQTCPSLWDAVRFAVDRRDQTGQFILTGSAVPADNAVKHTGTGRIARLRMRPMSLFESGDSTGEVSLSSLFSRAPDVEGASNLSIERLAFLIARGGWPASVRQPEGAALRHAAEYVNALAETDASRVDGIEKNPARVRAMLKSLARHTATTAAMTTLRDDIANGDISLSEKSVALYLNALRRLFVVEELPAWNPALRSKTAMRSSPKRHFADPSLAAAALHASPPALLDDFNTFGLLFESLCVRDLRVYAQALDGEVFHYRDKSDLEADAVVCLKDGRWGAVEVKLGAKAIDEAAASLLKLRDCIDTAKMRRPSFLMVLTGSQHALRRKDGVLVVPVGCLKS